MYSLFAEGIKVHCYMHGMSEVAACSLMTSRICILKFRAVAIASLVPRSLDTMLFNCYSQSLDLKILCIISCCGTMSVHSKLGAQVMYRDTDTKS